MNVDIRLPMGLMFTLTGLIMFVYAFLSDPAIYEQSLGVNMNLWWGLALLVFGGVMLMLSYRTMRGQKAKNREDAE